LDATRGSAQAGFRPVIVVSRDAINQNSSVVICVPCTDAAHCARIYPSQLLLKKGVGGLALNSVAMCEQIRAITGDRLSKYLGKLEQPVLRALDERLRIAFDLD
jgi:mRNA interferase MazF